MILTLISSTQQLLHSFVTAGSLNDYRGSRAHQGTKKAWGSLAWALQLPQRIQKSGIGRDCPTGRVRTGSICQANKVSRYQQHRLPLVPCSRQYRLPSRLPCGPETPRARPSPARPWLSVCLSRTAELARKRDFSAQSWGRLTSDSRGGAPDIAITIDSRGQSLWSAACDLMAVEACSTEHSPTDPVLSPTSPALPRGPDEPMGGGEEDGEICKILWGK